MGEQRKWRVLALLVAALGGLLLLGESLDRLPAAPQIVTADDPLLRGWRRQVVESLAGPPPELGGPGRPGFYPLPGIYERSLRVELRPDDRRASVVYTTDGSRPTPEHGTLYRRPLRLDVRHPGVTVIRAVQVLNGVPGPEVAAAYAVGLDSRLPVLSLAADPEHLWGAEAGILSNPSFRGRAWERPVQVAFLADRGGFAVPAGLRVHGSEPPVGEKRSLRLYFRRDYGPGRLTYPLFPEHPEQPEAAQSYNHLLLQAGDRRGWWTLFRDELVAETARSLGLPAAQGRFVHLFLNGRSWGIYRLSERVDRFYLADNFGYRDVDVVQEGAAEEGSDDDWDALVDWAVAHDLAEPEARDYVAERLDLGNFTDFAVLQLYFGFSAEDLYAVRDRGGRWHFVYGGGALHFAQRPEASLTALGLEESDFALLLRALMDDAGFRRRLRARAVTLLNTTLAPEAMAERVAGLEELLAADVSYEAARWPSPSPWADNVAQLRAFVAARPAAVRAVLGELLGLPAPVEVQVAVEPPEGGRVFAGGLPLAERGHFYSATDVTLMAVPRSGFAFAGWEGLPEPGAAPVVTWTVDGVREIAARFSPIPAGDPAPHPNDVVVNEFWINDDGTRYPSLEGRPLTGDWIELLVQRPEVVDLRGWRLTDEDVRAGGDEGSLVFPETAAFAAVPRGTVILVVVTENLDNAAYFPADDLDHADGRMVLYAGNGNLAADPGFGLGTRNESLALLAPGPAGEVGIDFVAEGRAVTPYTFGVLGDGVLFDHPFRRLGRDDGAIFAGVGSNDDGARDWIVDPTACESGDARCLDAVNLLTPGALNPGQGRALWMREWLLPPQRQR